MSVALLLTMASAETNLCEYILWHGALFGMMYNRGIGLVCEVWCDFRSLVVLIRARNERGMCTRTGMSDMFGDIVLIER